MHQKCHSFLCECIPMFIVLFLDPVGPDVDKIEEMSEGLLCKDGLLVFNIKDSLHIYLW